MNNQRGYALIALCLMMSTLFAMFFMVSWTVWFGYQKQRVEKICFTYTLKAQRALIKSGQQVLALNPKALSLIGQKKYWRKVAATAPPKVKAFALAMIAQIKVQQAFLKAKQKLIIINGHRGALAALAQLKIKLRKALLDVGSTWSDKRTYAMVRVYSPRPQVEKMGKETAPPYRLKYNYRKQQEISAHYHTKLQNDYSPELVVNGTKNKWRSSCYSHPTKKGGVWRATIGKAKYSSRLSVF